MARGDIPYTRLECNIFMHAVIGTLDPDCFSTWVKLQCYAVHERRETLNFPPYSWQVMAKICGFSAGKTQKICRKLAKLSPEKPLLIIGDTYLTICGARAKNPGLKWKDAPTVPQPSPNRSPVAPYGSGSGSVIGSGSVTHAPTGAQNWVAVACTLTGRPLPDEEAFRATCLADAKALFEHHGDTANAVLAPLKGATRFPSKLLADAVRAIGGGSDLDAVKQALAEMEESP